MSAFGYHTATPGTTSATATAGESLTYMVHYADLSERDPAAVSRECNVKDPYAAYILPDHTIVGLSQALSVTWKLALLHHNSTLSAFALLHFQWLSNLQDRTGWLTQPPTPRLAIPANPRTHPLPVVYQRRFRRRDRTIAASPTRNPR